MTTFSSFANENLCAYKEALVQLNGLAKKATRTQVGNLLFDNGIFITIKYNDDISKSYIMKFYNGNISFLFHDKNAYKFFKKFLAQANNNCLSGQYMKERTFMTNNGKYSFRFKAMSCNVINSEGPGRLCFDFAVYGPMIFDEWAMHYYFMYKDKKLILIRIDSAG
jgi:hypothetical protein